MQVFTRFFYSFRPGFWVYSHPQKIMGKFFKTVFKTDHEED